MMHNWSVLPMTMTKNNYLFQDGADSTSLVGHLCFVASSLSILVCILMPFSIIVNCMSLCLCCGGASLLQGCSLWWIAQTTPFNWEPREETIWIRFIPLSEQPWLLSSSMCCDEKQFNLTMVCWFSWWHNSNPARWAHLRLICAFVGAYDMIVIDCICVGWSCFRWGLPL